MDEWVPTFAYKQNKSLTVSVKATGRERWRHREREAERERERSVDHGTQGFTKRAN